MEPNKNYMLVGLFVLLGFVGLALFGIWLAGRGNDESYSLYQIHFIESVNGLGVGSAVKYRGVEVGRVQSIRIDRADARAVRVVVRILSDTPIKKDTAATMKIQGITGASYVNLEGGTPALPDLVVDANGELPEIRAKISDLGSLMNQAPALMDQTVAVVERMQRLLNDKNLDKVASILDHIDAVSAQVEQSRVDALIANLYDTSTHVKNFSQRADAAAAQNLSEVEGLVTELRQTSREVRALSQKIGDNPSQLIYPSQETGIDLP